MIAGATMRWTRSGQTTQWPAMSRGSGERDRGGVAVSVVAVRQRRAWPRRGGVAASVAAEGKGGGEGRRDGAASATAAGWRRGAWPRRARSERGPGGAGGRRTWPRRGWQVQLRRGDDVGVGPGREMRGAALSTARLTMVLDGGPTQEGTQMVSNQQAEQVLVHLWSLSGSEV